ARQRNLRSTELMTISGLRRVQDSRQEGKALGRVNVTEKGVARISQWIEDDAVSQEMYSERLDQILELGEQSDRDALPGTQLKDAGTEIMSIWNDLDRGTLKQDEAFEEADKAARRKSAEKDM